MILSVYVDTDSAISDAKFLVIYDEKIEFHRLGYEKPFNCLLP